MLPIDPALPGLNAALDPSALLARFARAPGWQPLAEASELKLVRFRHRRGKRAVFLYSAGRADTLDDAVLLTGEIRADGSKGKRGSQAMLAPSSCDVRGVSVPSSCYFADIGLSIQRFPHDRRLPKLAEFVNASAERCVRWDGANPRLVRYVPGQRATFRLSADKAKPADGAGDQPFRYLKFVRPEVLERAEADLDALTDWARSDAVPFAINVPTGVHRDLGAIAYETASGSSLLDVLGAGGGCEDVSEALADGFAAFHAARTRVPYSSTDETPERVMQALDWLGWAWPEGSTDVAKLARLYAMQRPPEPSGIVHGDLKPEHIFACGTQFELIDLACPVIGNPMDDIGNLLARLCALTEGAPSCAPQIARFITTFVSRYAAKVPSGWMAGLGHGVAGGEVLLALHNAQRLSPDWRSRVAWHIGRALRALRGNHQWQGCSVSFV